MMKKFVSLLVSATLAFASASSVCAKNFSDVPVNHSLYEAINALSDDGIITGYEDGTFKIDHSITRAEAATIIVRASGEKVSDELSSYVDVENSFWGRKYIMQATKMGIVHGVGNNMFKPYDDVTYKEIIKMIVCMLGKGKEAMNKGGWPNGYLKVARENNIISDYYAELYSRSSGDKPASRGDVASLIYKALGPDEYKLTVGGKAYALGMAVSNLPVPDERLNGVYEWYVYDTDSYENFFAAGVEDGKVVILIAVGEGFVYNGYEAGEVMPDNSKVTSYLQGDKNDSNRVHAVKISYSSVRRSSLYEYDKIAAEAKMNFHCTNAFRVYHGDDALIWSENAAKAARLHSEDMAENDYFSHDSLDGTEFSERLENQGINWRGCAENICAGRVLGFDAYTGWVNSAGHRKNMLGDYKYLGVGGGYDENSQYAIYYTQDFYK